MNIHSIYDLFFRLFRPGRLALFYREFGVRGETRVLDVGGGLAFWEMARRQGLAVPNVTVVNLSSPPPELPRGLTWVVGDACSLPFADRSFDVAFSNSVVEHLGGAGKQAEFAWEIQRVARGYFVQTPHRSFPVEPHLMTPFLHWLPLAVRRLLLRNFTVWGLITRPSPAECASYLLNVRLFNRRELEALLPASDVRVERFLLWPKSLLAFWGRARYEAGGLESAAVR